MQQGRSHSGMGGGVLFPWVLYSSQLFTFLVDLRTAVVSVLSARSSLLGGFLGSGVVEHFNPQCGLEREKVCLRNRCQSGVARVMDEALDDTAPMVPR